MARRQSDPNFETTFLGWHDEAVSEYSSNDNDQEFQDHISEQLDVEMAHKYSVLQDQRTALAIFLRNYGSVGCKFRNIVSNDCKTAYGTVFNNKFVQKIIFIYKKYSGDGGRKYNIFSFIYKYIHLQHNLQNKLSVQSAQEIMKRKLKQPVQNVINLFVIRTALTYA